MAGGMESFRIAKAIFFYSVVNYFLVFRPVSNISEVHNKHKFRRPLFPYAEYLVAYTDIGCR